MKQNEEYLRGNISSRREIFILNVINAHERNNLNALHLSKLLEDYEEIAQAAVQGNLQLTNTDKNLTEAFPVQDEKWTILQAVFFASTICTTIGKSSHDFVKYFVLHGVK